MLSPISLSPPEFHYFPVEKLISQEKMEVKNLEKHIWDLVL